MGVTLAGVAMTVVALMGVTMMVVTLAGVIQDGDD